MTEDGLPLSAGRLSRVGLPPSPGMPNGEPDWNQDLLRA
jgi:hypothetical protein